MADLTYYAGYRWVNLRDNHVWTCFYNVIDVDPNSPVMRLDIKEVVMIEGQHIEILQFDILRTDAALVVKVEDVVAHQMGHIRSIFEDPYANMVKWGPMYKLTLNSAEIWQRTKLC